MTYRGCKYRNNLEIISDILFSILSHYEKDEIIHGLRKLHIMYEANLSHDLLIDYLDLMLKKEFLEFDSITKLYSVTEKGLDYLQEFDEFKSEYKKSESKEVIESAFRKKFDLNQDSFKPTI